MLKRPRFGQWEPFKLALVLFDWSPSFFEHFLTVLHRQIFQTHFVLSLPQIWNYSFVQGALVPFSGEWYVDAMVWAPGVLTATGVPLHVGSFSTPSWVPQFLHLLNTEQSSLPPSLYEN